MTYKLIALDMDGTLLNDQKQISAENAEWIARAEAQGLIVMLATGRGIQNILPFVKQLGLQSPIVAVNGGEIWRSPGTIHKRILLNYETIRALRQIALELNIWYWAYTTEGLMNKQTWTDIPLEEQSWLKFGFASEDREKLKQLELCLKSVEGIEITSSNWTNREINPTEVTKASGIAEVCRLKGFKMEQCVAVGDGANDLSMLRACGFGVAMDNAPVEVKQIADRVTGSNNEHGVAQILQYIITCNNADESQHQGVDFA